MLNESTISCFFALLCYSIVSCVVFLLVFTWSKTSSGTTVKSDKLSAQERKNEYRCRGKSPSGVIDGVYNDDFLEPGRIYSDADRDWEADA